MSRTHIELGESGEQLAVEFLSSKGYKILERNFKSKLGEIDIVAKDKKTICFIEVKTRSNLEKGLPQESITMRKQHQISKTALSYLKFKGFISEDKVWSIKPSVLKASWTIEEFNFDSSLTIFFSLFILFFCGIRKISLYCATISMGIKFS